MILPSGSVNPDSIVAPGVYILEKLPTSPITGVSTSKIGVVGTASWGPVNSPVTIGSLQEHVATYGNPAISAFDMGTQVYAATSVGASSFECVRVTDGTDVKALVDINDVTLVPVVGMTLNAMYSGTVGNTINAAITAGTNSTIGTPTFKITISLPTGNGSSIPETFDNIGGTGVTLWQNMVNAVNMGQGVLTAPSSLVVATIGTATAAPKIDNYVLANGTNGNSGVIASTLIGSSVLPLTGMYALTGSGFSLLVVSGVTDATTYAAQVTFGQQQGAYAMLARPFAESYSAGITAKKTAGLDNFEGKLFVGETWIKIQDEFNKVQRYISQQGLAAGEFSLLSPQDSGLNKIINSSIFVSTYFADQNKKYTSADIVSILQNGLDTIANPSPGGAYWAMQTGKNTSSNPLANGDQFSRLTNFLAASLNRYLGVYVGKLQTPSQRIEAKSVVISFLHSLATQNVIGATNGGQAFSVVIDNTNNPPNQVALGIETADVKVAFFQVIVAFLVNLQTGLTQIVAVQPQ